MNEIFSEFSMRHVLNTGHRLASYVRFILALRSRGFKSVQEKSRFNSLVVCLLVLSIA